MVELLTRYSNRTDKLDALLKVLELIETDDRTDEPGVQSAGSPEPWRVSDRLSPADVQTLLNRFRAGTPKHKLAAEYGISESTIKRLLRKHRGS